MPSSGPAAAETPDRQPPPSPRTMLVQSLKCIFRTGGVESTLPPQKRSQGCLVRQHAKPETPNAKPSIHVEGLNKARRASRRNAAYSSITKGWCGRTFTTTSTPSAQSCCCNRKASRRQRRIRFRVTALPTRLGRLKPSLGPSEDEPRRTNTNNGPTRRERRLAYTASNPARFRRRC